MNSESRSSQSIAQELVTELGQNVQNFLKGIDNLFIAKNVNCKVSQNYQLLMRILTPSQYLKNLEQINNKQKNKNSNIQIKHNSIKKVKPTQTTIVIDNNSFEQSEISPKFVNYGQNQEQFQDKKKNLNQKNKMLSNNKLDKSESQWQKQLAKWIRIQYIYSQNINQIDISKKAKNLNKNKNFIASRSWYTKFLRKNPDLEPLISRMSKIQLNRIPPLNKSKATQPYYYNIQQQIQQHKNQQPDKNSDIQVDSSIEIIDEIKVEINKNLSQNLSQDEEIQSQSEYSQSVRKAQNIFKNPKTVIKNPFRK